MLLKLLKMLKREKKKKRIQKKQMQFKAWRIQDTVSSTNAMHVRNGETDMPMPETSPVA